MAHATRNTRTKKPTGYILYRGASLINGEPIVAIVIVGKSKNSKTGNMVQTYILPDNGKSPLENLNTLEDASVCGDCKHRRGTGGACYVNVGQGVMQVWKAYKKGNYPKANLHEIGTAIQGRKLRLGTYGDPMAVPALAWMYLVNYAADHTGYTHQWNNPNIDDEQKEDIRTLCMASVDSEDERALAGFERWRTFRVRDPREVQTDRKTEAVLREITCPASEEAGKRKQCSDCMACDGVGTDEQRIKRPDIVITVHGSLKKRFHDAQAFLG